jgi:hypothetical protein
VPIGQPLFVLPAGDRPLTIRTFPIAAGLSAGVFGGDDALLIVEPSGKVALLGARFTDPTELFLGEVMFRTDA